MKYANTLLQHRIDDLIIEYRARIQIRMDDILSQSVIMWGRPAANRTQAQIESKYF